MFNVRMKSSHYFRSFAFLALATGCIAFPAAELQSTNDNELTGRIVGGHPTDIINYPHQISLRFKNILAPGNPFRHRCGGSIINEYWVVTAAHCIIATVASQFQIVAGTNNRRGSDGVILPVVEIIMHEKYNPDNFDNDIALLRLGEPIPVNNFTMNAIKLADAEPAKGAISTVTGWGSIAAGASSPETLLAVNVPIVSNDDCNRDYEGLILESMLCAGLRGEGGKDACQGDSGGPLIIQNKLYGVVSWGYGCARPEYPGVYANVAYLRPWLNEHLPSDFDL